MGCIDPIVGNDHLVGVIGPRGDETEIWLLRGGTQSLGSNQYDVFGNVGEAGGDGSGSGVGGGAVVTTTAITTPKEQFQNEWFRRGKEGSKGIIGRIAPVEGNIVDRCRHVVGYDIFLSQRTLRMDGGEGFLRRRTKQVLFNIVQGCDDGFIGGRNPDGQQFIDRLVRDDPL